MMRINHRVHKVFNTLTVSLMSFVAIGIVEITLI